MTIPTIHCPHCLGVIPYANLVHVKVFDVVDDEDMRYTMYLEGKCSTCDCMVSVDIDFEPCIVTTRAYKGEVVYGDDTDSLKKEVE